MLKNFLCSLPLSIKKVLGKIKSYASLEKTKQINLIDSLETKTFININTKLYKKNLKKFLRYSSFNSKETSDYIKWLYWDELVLLYSDKMNYNYPTIICVIKNEADKLNHFFQHYKLIGKFNYIFIDNGSTDNTRDIIKSNNGTIYSCLEQFCTNRKIAWINKVFSTLPNDCWSILLDADELLVYDGYEKISINSVLEMFDRKGISTGGAVMIDMFSNKLVSRNNYIEKYVYFENYFREEKSYYFNSIYGGIREREFKFNNDRIFLIKKHPVVKKENGTMLIHCHYIFPFNRNFESKNYFGLLHYKLFDSEVEKYKEIAKDGVYSNSSIEYKNYLAVLANKTYEQIFAVNDRTEKYSGTLSLQKICCLLNVGEIFYE